MQNKKPNLGKSQPETDIAFSPSLQMKYSITDAVYIAQCQIYRVFLLWVTHLPMLKEPPNYSTPYMKPDTVFSSRASS